MTKDLATPLPPRSEKATQSNADALVEEVRQCTACAAQLPSNPRPVLQVHPAARILIAGQAPGRKVNESGVPFDDASGERLRDWMGVTRDVFYEPSQIAILPMGFCYPGTGRSGDLPPRSECAPLWRERLLEQMQQIELTLLIGDYAQRWHLPGAESRNVTDTVAAWRTHWPTVLPMPHPSPRNNIWLKINPWFVAEVVPALRVRVAALLAT